MSELAAILLLTLIVALWLTFSRLSFRRRNVTRAREQRKWLHVARSVHQNLHRDANWKR